ncbi:MAG: ACP S-malonyltransferase [Thermoleophilia bacterium]
MIVATFPGQGAQVVGMGRAMVRRHAAARRVFEEADDVLGYSLSELCFEGPMERLTETHVCQPALVATSMAAFRVAEEAGFRPDLVMGHSLGEYSALVAAGAMEYAEALRIVAERGAAMRDAGRESPGSMAALIAVTDEAAADLADRAGDAWPANFNCPGQVVVSGTAAAIDRLLEIAAEQGTRATRLQVDGAFHSRLMAPAAERLRPALEAWDPSPPDPPFLSTTTALVEPAERLREVLLDQLTAPVRFGDATAAAVRLGARSFVEFGVGRVLSTLVRRVQRDLEVMQIQEPDDIAGLPVAR